MDRKSNHLATHKSKGSEKTGIKQGNIKNEYSALVKSNYSDGGSHEAPCNTDTSTNSSINQALYSRQGGKNNSAEVNSKYPEEPPPTLKQRLRQLDRHRIRKKYYVDNLMNKKLGRVGKLRGTHVYHKDGTVTIISSPDKKSNDRTKSDLLSKRVNAHQNQDRSQPSNKNATHRRRKGIKGNRVRKKKRRAWKKLTLIH